MNYVERKATRLVADGRVTRLDRSTFAVHGDTGRYLVATVPLAIAEEHGVPAFICSCPARGICSHALAAHAVRLGDDEQARVPA